MIPDEIVSFSVIRVFTKQRASVLCNALYLAHERIMCGMADQEPWAASTLASDIRTSAYAARATWADRSAPTGILIPQAPSEYWADDYAGSPEYGRSAPSR
jgi:hypothetical protein